MVYMSRTRQLIDSASRVGLEGRHVPALCRMASFERSEYRACRVSRPLSIPASIQPVEATGHPARDLGLRMAQRFLHIDSAGTVACASPHRSSKSMYAFRASGCANGATLHSPGQARPVGRRPGLQTPKKFARCRRATSRTRCAVYRHSKALSVRRVTTNQALEATGHPVRDLRFRPAAIFDLVPRAVTVACASAHR